MKKIILILSIVTLAYSSQIDSSLFDNFHTSASLLQIEKDINNQDLQKLKEPNSVKLEILTLKKLKQIHKIKDEIKTFEIIIFSKSNISEETYIKAFYLLGELQSEIKRLKEKKIALQQKLFELKVKIEKTLPKDANSSLLVNQMEYAIYKISQKKITKSLKHYKILFEKEFDTFKEVLNRVDFKKQQIIAVQNRLEALNDQSKLLNIDKDSEALRGKIEQEKIQNREKKIQKQTNAATQKKLQVWILLSFKELKNENEKKFLQVTEQMQDDLKKLSEVEKERFLTLNSLLISFATAHFDKSSLALTLAAFDLQNFTDAISHFMNKTLFVYEEKALNFKTILTFILTVLIGFIVAKFYKKIVDRYRKSNTIKSLSASRMLANSGYYLIIIFTFFVALKVVGLDMHTIFLTIGALLLWVSLGLQGFISNYAMGILLRINRSIRIGDFIEVDSKVSGLVDDMDFRSVIIVTDDNTRVIIPNSKFISNSFINHSLEESIKRIHIYFSVDRGIDFPQIQKEILSSLNRSNIPHIKQLEQKAQVIISDINKDAVRYSLLVWVNHQNKYDEVLEKSAFLSLIHQSLKKVTL